MDKQREEFEKLLGNEFDPEGIYWEWFKKGQTAMQPEINFWRTAQAETSDVLKETEQQLSAANQRIQELEAIIKASQEQEPVAWYDPKDTDETEAFMYPNLRNHHIEHNSSVKNYLPLYAKPVIKEQP